MIANYAEMTKKYRHDVMAFLFLLAEAMGKVAEIRSASNQEDGWKLSEAFIDEIADKLNFSHLTGDATNLARYVDPGHFWEYVIDVPINKTRGEDFLEDAIAKAIAELRKDPFGQTEWLYPFTDGGNVEVLRRKLLKLNKEVLFALMDAGGMALLASRINSDCHPECILEDEIQCAGCGRPVVTQSLALSVYCSRCEQPSRW